MISWEVFSRYVLNNPHDWALDAQTDDVRHPLIMMAGAYTLSKNGHVRGDVLYGFFRPRTQATLDLILYFLFFLPGVVAMTWAGWIVSPPNRWPSARSTFSGHAAAAVPVQVRDPRCRRHAAAAGHRRDRALRAPASADGVWPSREQDVEEVDVDKLKAMVHVKDEDIAALDKFVAPASAVKARDRP